MQKIIIGFLMIASASSYAFDAKVICGGGENGASYTKDAVASLNAKIKQAIQAGYTSVSAPTVTADSTRDYPVACVTVSK